MDTKSKNVLKLRALEFYAASVLYESDDIKKAEEKLNIFMNVGLSLDKLVSIIKFNPQTRIFANEVLYTFGHGNKRSLLRPEIYSKIISSELLYEQLGLLITEEDMDYHDRQRIDNQ
ncbi:hypothetical protein GOV08_00435 [Candidatus Woesearchaeota archaeon]|nr:hypothetical protein [Candidatus Woesearchaeota archaeon]